jgi:hypothetical protein
MTSANRHGDKNKVSIITRRDIVDWLLLRETRFHGRLDQMDFLKRIWDLKSMPSTDKRFDDLEGDIWMHSVNFNDWDDSELLTGHLDLLEAPDSVFFKFLETVLHPLAVSSADSAREIAAKLNSYLELDGFKLVEKESISGRPVFKVEQFSVGTGSGQATRYEVVLSFAGEQREYVEAVADALRAAGVSLFYDRYEEATLWGKELTEHLDTVYRGSARYCVMFISKEYAQKVWTTAERRSAFARALEEKQEYILPARFDGTGIPGLRPTIGYVDLKTKTPDQLAKLILQKLGRSGL